MLTLSEFCYSFSRISWLYSSQRLFINILQRPSKVLVWAFFMKVNTERSFKCTKLIQIFKQVFCNYELISFFIINFTIFCKNSRKYGCNFSRGTLFGVFNPQSPLYSQFVYEISMKLEMFHWSRYPNKYSWMVLIFCNACENLLYN